MTEPDPLRKRIAHSIHRYDNHHALSGNDIPSQHHYGEADFVLAELRAELAAADPELQRRLEAAIAALGKSETELAALRQVARGYCPHCGRGDAAPGVDDWEEQRQRADQAEAALAHLQATSEAAGRLLTRTTDECDQLRAALARVADLADEYPAGIDTALIHAALDEPAVGPAATQATSRPT